MAAIRMTMRIQLGTGIIPVFGRGPAVVAIETATKQIVRGCFVLGLGGSSGPIATRWRGEPYVKSVTRLREYVEVLRRMLDSERIVHEGYVLDRWVPGRAPAAVAAADPRSGAGSVDPRDRRTVARRVPRVHDARAGKGDRRRGGRRGAGRGARSRRGRQPRAAGRDYRRAKGHRAVLRAAAAGCIPQFRGIPEFVQPPGLRRADRRVPPPLGGGRAGSGAAELPDELLDSLRSVAAPTRCRRASTSTAPQTCGRR